MIFITLLVLAFAIKLGLDGYEQYSFCRMDGQISCFSPVMGTDGFWLKFSNSHEGTIYIQDITISQKDGERCLFLRPEIADADRDYYSTILPDKSQPFFTDRYHPDGSCLMEGLVPGEDYRFIVEVTYFFEGEKMVASGKGKTFFFDREILPENYDDSLIH